MADIWIVLIEDPGSEVDARAFTREEDAMGAALHLNTYGGGPDRVVRVMKRTLE
jgi:hypothetical protein